MSPRSGRFSPPEVAFSPELRWVLAAGFGPPPPAGASALDGTAVWELAARLSLASRIAARQSFDLLADSLGAEVAERFRAVRRAAVATALVYDGAAVRLSAIAVAMGTPLVLLKGFAVNRLAHLPGGARPFADLDVLVASNRARDFHAALAADGYTAAAVPANDQHLPPLTSRQFGSVDVHFRLRGLRLPGPATAEALVERQLVEPLPDLPGAAIPKRALLATHILVHGLVQHGHRPATYPMLRMMGDLIDLLLSPEAWRELEMGAKAWADHTLRQGDLSSVRACCSALKRGELPGAGQGEIERQAGRLVAHAIAGVYDEGYRRELTAGHLSGRLWGTLRDGTLGEYLSSKLQHLQSESRRPGSEPAPWGLLRRLGRVLSAGVKGVTRKSRHR